MSSGSLYTCAYIWQTTSSIVSCWRFYLLSSEASKDCVFLLFRSWNGWKNIL